MVTSMTPNSSIVDFNTEISILGYRTQVLLPNTKLLGSVCRP